MTRQQISDIYFMEARSKLLELAAFFDRVVRAEGQEDFRVESLRAALRLLGQAGQGRVEAVLMTLSDPTSEPIPAATTKVACGAWNRAILLK